MYAAYEPCLCTYVYINTYRWCTGTAFLLQQLWGEERVPACHRYRYTSVVYYSAVFSRVVTKNR